jgi:hypothetical protein
MQRKTSDTFDLFYITNTKERFAMVKDLSVKTMKILIAQYELDSELRERVNQIFQCESLDGKTQTRIQNELRFFLSEKLEDVLWVASLDKGNTTLTHKLSELRKYELTENDLMMVFRQLMLDKELFQPRVLSK